MGILGVEPSYLYLAEEIWEAHVIYILQTHLPSKVKHDENNFPMNIEIAGNSKRKKWKGIWKIQAAKTWPQPNDYIYGTIALNRFAFELRKYKSNQAVDETTLQLIQSQDKLKDKNFQNAADLLEHLLKTNISVLASLSTDKMISDSDSESMSRLSIEDESLPPNVDTRAALTDLV